MVDVVLGVDVLVLYCIGFGLEGNTVLSDSTRTKGEVVVPASLVD